jgi:hypothetical protein
VPYPNAAGSTHRDRAYRHRDRRLRSVDHVVQVISTLPPTGRLAPEIDPATNFGASIL